MSINTKKCKVALALGFAMFSFVTYAQQKLSDTHPAIMKFYEYIYNRQNVSISEFNGVYQRVNLNTEAWLIKEKCSRGEDIYCKKLQKIGNVFQNVNFSDTSSVFWELRSKYYSELTQGLSFEKISLIIKNLTIHYDGDINLQYAILSFPNNKKVYMALNADIEDVGFPAKITGIWLSNCVNLSELIIDNVTEKLQWLGSINKKNNRESIEIYEKPNSTSKVTGKFFSNQTFFFTPNEDSDWWPVYDYEKRILLGYINKHNILMFEDFPKELKAKVKIGC